MPATVLLKDIVDELEMQFDEWPSFVDLDTGEVHSVSQDLLREAEDSENEDGNWIFPIGRKTNGRWPNESLSTSTDFEGSLRNTMSTSGTL